MPTFIHPDSVSSSKRLGQVAFATLICLLGAGTIFGFAGLKPVLIGEGIYHDLCDASVPVGELCKEEDIQLNLLFTMATVSTNVAALPVGIALDRLGPRKLSITGTILLFLGFFLFGLGVRRPFFDSYMAGYFFIGLGGPMVFLPSFHLSNCFPERSGLILSAITGAFDASSIIFVIYNHIYKHTHLSPRIWFWGYCIVPVLILLEQIFYAPRGIYNGATPTNSQPKKAANEETPLLREDPGLSMIPEALNESDYVNASTFSRLYYGPDSSKDEILRSTLEQKDPITGMLFEQSAKQQIWSSWFFIITIFFCVHMVRINYYISTTWSQTLLFTGNLGLTQSIVTAFEILLPLGGAVSIPFIGWLLDRQTSFVAFAVLGVFGILFSSFTIAAQTWVQLSGIVIFVVLRPLMYTSISDIYTKILGMKTFGTVYGLSNTIAGVASLMQYPIDLLVQKRLDGDYLPVDIGLAVAGVLTSGLVLMRIYTATSRASD